MKKIKNVVDTKNKVCYDKKAQMSGMKKYSRGRRGAPAKGIGRVTGARVQIPPSSPYQRWSRGVAVNMPPCHGGDRGFDSRPDPHSKMQM